MLRALYRLIYHSGYYFSHLKVMELKLHSISVTLCCEEAALGFGLESDFRVSALTTRLFSSTWGTVGTGLRTWWKERARLSVGSLFFTSSIFLSCVLHCWSSGLVGKMGSYTTHWFGTRMGTSTYWAYRPGNVLGVIGALVLGAAIWCGGSFVRPTWK